MGINAKATWDKPDATVEDMPEFAVFRLADEGQKGQRYQKVRGELWKIITQYGSMMRLDEPMNTIPANTRVSVYALLDCAMHLIR